jgi:hypothetical protein
VRRIDLFDLWASRWRVIRTSNAYESTTRSGRSPVPRLVSLKIGPEHGIKMIPLTG